MTLEEFLSHLEHVKPIGTGYTACCPAHDDRKASLSISNGDKGQILLHCHAGCSVNKIVDSLGFKISDLFPVRNQEARSVRKIITSYPYYDQHGNLLCEKLRYSDKSFLWRKQGANGWEWNRKGLDELPLYRLHDLKGDTVYLVEGEKDVETMLSGGLPAVCSPDGAGKGKWKPYMSEQLRGCHVVVLQDNDDIGKAFAEEECSALTGIAASVKRLDLSELWEDMPDTADVTDYVDWCLSIGRNRESIFACLSRFAEELPEYTLPKESTGFDFIQYPVRCTSDIDFSKTPAVRFFIDDIISEGLSFLTAFSKVGKSRMILQMLLSICSGTPFLQKPTRQADVLYCAFEDEQIDFENRLKLFLNGSPLPENFYYFTKEDFNYVTPTLGADELLIPLIEHIIEQHPKVQVVAIDVFGVIRSKKLSGFDFTMHERADINELLRLASKHRIAIIVAHHVSKSGLHADRQCATGSGAGSYVVSGSVHAELEIALDRDDQKRARFSFKGRRIRSGSLAIRDEFPYWILEGNWDEIKDTQNPVVSMIQWLVDAYGSWIGSAKDFYEENLKSGQPLLLKKPNKRTFSELSEQLNTLGIQYIEHPNGSGAPKHEFRRFDCRSNAFIEVSEGDTWENITLS